MMKYLKFFAILVLSTFILGNTFSQSSEYINIKDAANKSLKSYLDKIPMGSEKQYGFDDRTELSRAKLGNVYSMYTLNKDFVNDNVLSTKNYLIHTNEWRVAIVVDGKYRAFLTIRRVKNEYKAVDFGASGLAEEIQNTESKLATISIKSLSILRIYQAKCDFVFDSSEMKDISYSYSVYPLRSAEKITDSINAKSDKGKGFRMKDVLNEIKNLKYEVGNKN